MADVQTLVDRNVEFASSFNQGDLAIMPRLSTLVLTCVDARVDPAHILGLELGDAVVMRNVGGRVTDDVIAHIGILQGLGTKFAGSDSFALEVAIVHHTDCGASRFANPQLRQMLGKAAGTGEAAIERLAITDPETSVAEDIDRLQAAPNLPDRLVVAGYVYDVTDGKLRETFPPAPLRQRA
jgi:carbonic anhydrase